MQLCANRRAGLKEATSVAAVDEASQRRDVVQNPERAAVGSHHQVCSLDLQVVNRHDRQTPSHAHPALSVVEAAVHARLRADEQQSLAYWIRAHHASDLVGGKIAVDRLETS